MKGNKKMKKKIFGILTFIVVMALACLVNFNVKAEDTPWQFLQEAFNGEGESCEEFEYSVVDNKIYIKLLKDVNANEGSDELFIPASSDVTLDLNGHLLNAKIIGSTTTIHRVIDLSGKLTVNDSSDITKDGSGTGSIGGGRLNPPFDGDDDYIKDGAGILVRSTGELTLNSGIITNNTASSSLLGGGGVAVAGGKFTMNGGAIYKNKARWGGGISLDEDSLFIMNGGRIYENEAMTMDGSAINMYYNYSSSVHGNNKTYLLGGKIYNNVANRSTNRAEGDDETVNGIVSCGSAVWVEGELVLGGDIQIYDNKQGTFDYVTNLFSDLTNDANLAIVKLDESDRGAGRYTVSISSELPLNNALIYLSKTSEVKKIVPLSANESLVDFAYENAIFDNGNYNYFFCDVRDEECLLVRPDGEGGYKLVTKAEATSILTNAKEAAIEEVKQAFADKKGENSTEYKNAISLINNALTLEEVESLKLAGLAKADSYKAGLSGGAIAGIIIGAIVLVAAGVCAFLFLKKKKANE